MEEPDQPNELHEAFNTVFKVGTKPSIIQHLRGMVPATRYLVRTTCLRSAIPHMRLRYTAHSP